VAAAPPGLTHSWTEANSLRVRAETHTGLPLVYAGVRVGGFFEAGCAASTTAAPLLFIPSFPRPWPRYFPPIPRLLAQILELGLLSGLSPLRSIGSGACSDSWLRSCFAPAWARPLAQAETFSSSSRFWPPSSVPSIAQIACPSQPMAIAARPCPPIANTARSH
jgi:hypothetical protein